MENFRITSDYHTHTTYSHGKGSVMDNVLSAREKQLEIVAITDHAKNHPLIGVRPEEFDKIRKDIENCQKQVDDIKILMGIEANIIGMSGAIDVEPRDQSKLDLLLVGFHLTAYQENLSDYFQLVWNGVTRYVAKPTKGQLERNTRAYLNAIKKNKIDILTHPGFRLGIDYKAVGQACADEGTYVELSSRHRTPNDSSIEDLLATDAMFVVNSDAHKVENVGKWDFALELIEKYNIPQSRIANCNGKKLDFRSKR
ncbi:MAG: PHP domain-containing protein [Clostridia bacterium]